MKAALAAALLLFSALATAEDDDVLYRKALESLHAGNLPEAIARLETLYKQAPNHAGGMLDLAILYCHSGQRERADELFLQIIQRFQPPPGVVELISYFRSEGCGAAPTPYTWRMTVSGGYESNVNQGSSKPTLLLGSGPSAFEVQLTDDFLPKGSPFRGVEGEGDVAVPQLGGRLQGYFMARQYPNARELDLGVVSLGYRRETVVKEWLSSTTVAAGYLTLGGKSYQESLLAETRVTPPVQFSPSFPLGIEARAYYSRYPTRPAFDSVEGSLLGVMAWQPAYHWQMRLAAGWVEDWALSDRPGGDRAGPAWLGELGYEATSRLKLGAGLYGKNLNSEKAYAPPLLDQVRRQRLNRARLYADWEVAENQIVRVEYQAVRQRDTFSLFEFNGQSLTFSWIWGKW